MKWKDLTAEQLLKLASDLDDHAYDMKFEREIIEEEQGFDLYAGYRCLARKLKREALRRSPEGKIGP